MFSTQRLFTAIVFIALFVMATREIADPDFWWHLRTGQVITSTGTIPHTDIFSITAEGKEWVTHEWLSEVIMYALYSIGGFGLLILAFAACITLAFGFVYLRSSGKPYLAGFCVILGALVTAPTWGVRPQMFSLLLTSVFLYLLDRYVSSGKYKFLLPIFPVMILWVNLHSGFAVGIVILAIYILGILVDRFFAARSKSAQMSSIGPIQSIVPLVVCLGACLFAVLLNPNGARMYSYPFETLTSHAMQAYIQEWFSPDFHQLEWLPFALLFILVLVSAFLGKAPLSSTQIVLVALFGLAGLRSARNIPLFALVATPVLAAELGAWLALSANLNEPQKTSRRASILNFVILLLVLLAGAIRVGTVLANQTNIEQATFPAAAVNWIEAQQPKPNLFNSYNWGGYLIWRLYPAYKVFIDGRADVYGDQSIEKYLSIYRTAPGWEQRLASTGVNVLLLEPDSPLAYALEGNPNWRQSFRDNKSVVFIRN